MANIYVGLRESEIIKSLEKSGVLQDEVVSQKQLVDAFVKVIVENNSKMFGDISKEVAQQMKRGF